MSKNNFVDVDKPSSVGYRIIEGDCEKRLNELRSHSIDCVFTSPQPLETDFDMLLITKVADKIHRVLTEGGSFWLNLSETHSPVFGVLELRPFKVATEICRRREWVCLDSLIWHKPPMDNNRYSYGGPNNAIRFKHDYDFIFRFVKPGALTYFDKSLTDAWTTSVLSAPVRPVLQGEPDSGYPREIIADCLLTTCPPGGTVLDPFCGWGETGVVALQNGMDFIGIEKERSMIDKINKRLAKVLAEDKAI
jgi:DNA modification methylase